jgi:hypothetical protein
LLRCEISTLLTAGLGQNEKPRFLALCQLPPGADKAQAADLLQEYEAKIVALERMVGRQALEIEFLKGVLKNAARPRSGNTSVIAGPVASLSQKDAG